MKTVKVRIALEIASTGEWHAYGYNLPNADDGWDDVMDSLEPLQEPYVKRHWIEAEVPVPNAEPAVVTGTAVEETAEAAEAA